MNWVEARLEPGAVPNDLYGWLANPARVHHFYNEPWWPDAYVVRLLTNDNIAECGVVNHVVEWDERPDIEHFGDYWGWAQAYFEAGSMLSVRGQGPEQLVHCTLNAHGIDGMAELRWLVRTAVRRVWLLLRWKLYLRRRWERDVGPPIKGDA